MKTVKILMIGASLCISALALSTTYLYRRLAAATAQSWLIKVRMATIGRLRSTLLCLT